MMVTLAVMREPEAVIPRHYDASVCRCIQFARDFGFDELATAFQAFNMRQKTSTLAPIQYLKKVGTDGEG